MEDCTLPKSVLQVQFNITAGKVFCYCCVKGQLRSRKCCCSINTNKLQRLEGNF